MNKLSDTIDNKSKIFILAFRIFSLRLSYYTLGGFQSSWDEWNNFLVPSTNKTLKIGSYFLWCLGSAAIQNSTNNRMYVWKDISQYYSYLRALLFIIVSSQIGNETL